MMDASPPTRVRYRVVVFAALLATVTYLDRACIGTLAPFIMKDLHLSKEQMSVVFSAFAVAYAAFEIPTAFWADRKGTRVVLTRIVAWWSVFTVLTGAAFNYASMVVTRFLFGIGEAGAWPCVARTFSRWIPLRQRGRIQGIFFAGAHFAGGVTPIIVLTLVPWIGWRLIFVIFGVLGLIWAVAWYRWFRDEPAQHPAINAAEVAEIAAGRGEESSHQAGWPYWKRLLSHRNTLPICCMYMPNSFAFYFCITWLPTYLRERHGFDSSSLGFFTGLPLVMAVTGDLFGGVLCDSVTRRWGIRIGRVAVGAVSYLVAGVAMLLAANAASGVVAMVFFSTALAAAMFMLAPAWSTCMDVGGKNVGVVSAAMNTAGQVGSIACPFLVTYVLGRSGDWNMPLFFMGGLFLFGAACWLLIDPRKKIFD